MKTTSYETSKALKKAKFKKPTEFFYFDNNSHQVLEFHGEEEQINEDSAEGLLPAYDLETIIEALPGSITLNKSSKSSLKTSDFFTLKHNEEIIQMVRITHSGMRPIHYEIDETLANTAARLLLLLHKKGIIKFDEVKK